MPTENNEIIENVEKISVPVDDEILEKSALKQKPKQDSENSNNSEKSFMSVDSFAGDITPLTTNAPSTGLPPTKTDIEKLEQSTGRRFSAEIDAINEKLHRLNSVVKMSKDIETIAKENLVKSDILKKLTMKEKWLAENSASNSNALAPKSAFENRFLPKQDVLKEPKENARTAGENNKECTAYLAESVLEKLKTELKSENSNENASTDIKKLTAAQKVTSPEEVLASLKAEIKSASLNRQGSLKRQQLSPTASPSARKKPSSSASHFNSFQSKATQETKESAKSDEVKTVSRTNSLKRSEKFTSKDEVIANDSRMQIQNLWGPVKSIDNKKEMETNTDSKGKALGPNRSDSDIGKLLYDAESKFSPKIDRRLMQEKLKEIEAKNFSGTMDAIKSQMVVPTVSSQANLSVDLSKYFPDQKQQKANAATVNKNQKNLKDVDLAKYFPSSPTPQRRSAIVTVADKLRKSQTENAIAPALTTSTNASTNKVISKRQASLGNTAFSLRDHQLDGAVDLSKKNVPVVANKDAVTKSSQATVTTTTATAAVTKKGNVKIIKKIVPKKKVEGNATKKVNGVQNNTSIVPRDESDRVLDEILQSNDKEMYSPSAEYLKLFKEEKSPSEDISDKIENIFQEIGIDLGIAEQVTSNNKKRLLKTKSLEEEEFERLSKERNMATAGQTTKEDGDRPIGVQGLLARFESMSSVKSSEQSFKLRRMESTISNLNKSRESLISHDSIMSHESDSVSDLEKTMEYLKSEWRNEATNFLQKKRDNFFSKKRAIQGEETAAKQKKQEEIKSEALKKSKYEDLPVQYRESKFAKFFGIKSKSTEKIKTKSPEKKNVATTKKALVNGGTMKKSPSPSKNLNKTTATKTKMFTNLQFNSKDAKRKSPSPTKTQSKTFDNTKNNAEKVSKPAGAAKKSISSPKNQMEDFETLLLVEKGSIMNSEAKVSPVHDQNIIEAQFSSDPNTESISIVAPDGGAATATETTVQTKNVCQNSNNSDNSAPETPVLKRRPLVEDIKNLPKTGCDKSLSNSRRNSAASLHSRRCSDVSLEEKLDTAATKLTQSSPSDNIDELFENIAERLANKHTEQNVNTEEECDSLCTSISKSPSVAPTTVRVRGSSEDESIEKLFSQFSDEMLVNVEFDSNDELVGITPRIPLQSTAIEEDADFVDRLESLEKDEVSTVEFAAMESPKASSESTPAEEQVSAANQNIKTIRNEYDESVKSGASQKSLCNVSATKARPLTLESIQSMLYMDPQEMPFPIRPQRRQKSTSSSSEASAPIAPQRIKHKLAKLFPYNMPPSVQDLMQATFTKSLTAELAATGGVSIHKFPRNISEDELEEVKENHYQNQPAFTERSNPMTENTNNVQRSNTSSNKALSNRNTLIGASNVREIKQKEYGKTNDMQTIKFEESKANHFINQQPTQDITSTNSPNMIPEMSAITEVSINEILTSSKECPLVLRRNSQNSFDEKTSNGTESPTMQQNHIPSAINGNTNGTEAISNTSRRLSKSSVLEQITTPLKQSPLLQRKLSQPSTTNDKVQTLNDFPITQSKAGQISNVDLANSPLQVLGNTDSAASLSTTTNYTGILNGDNTKSLNNDEMLSVPASCKASSKERSLEWDMTKMPASPMPCRKFIHAERRGLEEARIKDVSPTSSIRLLNNISSNSSDSDERRIIADFEMERRQALIQRDKEYKELEKKESENVNIQKVRKSQSGNKINSNNNSECTTPSSTRMSSRRGTQDCISIQREGTPPNFKKLLIPADAEDLPSLSSRCSSFAFIELMSNGEAREAPMPQKLKIPTKPQPIILPEITEPIAEVFQNRPWPKAELSPEIDMSDSPDTVVEVKRANSAPKSPVAEVFRNRKWPDGKTVFDEGSEQHSDDDDFIRKVSKNRSKYRKMQSHSPEPIRYRLATDELSDDKMSSKSISDLRKDSPITSIYEAGPSLNFGTRSTRSSAENSSTHPSISEAPKRPMRHVPVGQTPEQTIDASTRMLLDRSKRLHNRKSEFINERAAERNPYLRDVVNAERIERESLEAAEDELECYRPSGYKSKQLTRFPTSRTHGRDHSGLSNSHYSYTPTYNSDYALSNRRLYGTPTLPYTSTASLNYNPYLTSGSSAYGGAIGRSLHFNDYTRRSPSRHRERELSKESCVIA